MNSKQTKNEKDIFKIINSHGKISFNQLRKMVIQNKICADGTFQKVLKNMEENNKVIRCPTGVDQYVYYYANKELYNFEKTMEKNIDEIMMSFEKKFKVYQDEYVKLSEEDKTTVFSSLTMLLFCIKVKITSINWVSRDVNFINHKIMALQDKVNNISTKLMEFVMSQDDHLKILMLTDSRFNLLGETLENELENLFQKKIQ